MKTPKGKQSASSSSLNRYKITIIDTKENQIILDESMSYFAMVGSDIAFSENYMFGGTEDGQLTDRGWLIITLRVLPRYIAQHIRFPDQAEKDEYMALMLFLESKLNSFMTKPNAYNERVHMLNFIGRYFTGFSMDSHIPTTQMKPRG